MNTLLRAGTRLVPVLFLAAMAVSPGSSPDAVLPLIPGTISLYPLNETTGSKVEDASGQPVGGVLQGEIERVEGRFGGAFRFASFETLVRIPVRPEQENWTLQAWTEFPLPATGSGYRTLAANYNGGHVSVNSDGYLGVYTPKDERELFHPCDTRFNVRELVGWHRLTAVARDGHTLFYLDQERVGEVEAALRLPVEVIGNATDLEQNWGSVDEVAICEGEILADEIAAQPLDEPLAASEGKTLCLFRFDEPEGDFTVDEATPRCSGSFTGAVIRGPGLAGLALDFAGPDALLQLLATPRPIDTWTFQAWTRFPLTGAAPQGRVLAGNGSEAAIAMSAGAELGCITGGFHGCGYTTDGLNGWHLLTAVGEANQTKFYVDADFAGVASGQSTAPIREIGNAVTMARPWGCIDGFRVLEVARSPVDIAADAYPALPAPGAPVQVALDGSIINHGGSTHDGFSVRVVLNDLRRDELRLQLQLKPVGSGWGEDVVVATGEPVAAGAIAEVGLRGILAGDYDWRVRGLGTAGRVTGWIEGGAAADIRITNAVPSGRDASQRLGAEGAEIPAGGQLGDADLIRFSVRATDADGTDLVRLRVRLQRAGSGEPIIETGPEVVAGGSAFCETRLGTGTWTWSWQVVDRFGGESAWTAFGAGSPDFEISSTGSIGHTGCLLSAGSSSAAILLGLLLLLRGRR